MLHRTRLIAASLMAVLMPAVHAGAQTPPPSPAVATTIHDAATKGDLQTVKAAIAADPTVVDAEKPPNKKTALHYAAQNGHADVVAFLLDKGADVNRPNIAGETPLHYAVGLPDPAVVNLLLARGANPNARTTERRPRRCGWRPRSPDLAPSRRCSTRARTPATRCRTARRCST